MGVRAPLRVKVVPFRVRPVSTNPTRRKKPTTGRSVAIIGGLAAAGVGVGVLVWYVATHGSSTSTPPPGTACPTGDVPLNDSGGCPTNWNPDPTSSGCCLNCFSPAGIAAQQLEALYYTAVQNGNLALAIQYEAQIARLGLTHYVNGCSSVW
jgi:hypothetical protein